MSKASQKVCRECRKRRALYWSPSRQKFAADRYHDLCMQCQRALRNATQDHAGVRRFPKIKRGR